MTQVTTGRRAVFLDRDGVLNFGGKVDRVEEFNLVPTAPVALSSLRAAGYLLILTTNQGGLGEDREGNVIWDKARLDRTHLTAIHDRMQYLLGLNLDAIKFCPHAYWDPRGECQCHKPLPGMIIEAAREFGIDLEHSWMIGDRSGDMDAAAAAGMTNRILVKTGEHANEEQKVKGGLFIVPSVFEAANLILALKRSEGPYAC